MKGRAIRRSALALIVYASIAVLLFLAGEGVVRLLVEIPEGKTAVGERRFVSWLASLSVPSRDPAELYREDDRFLWALQPGARIDGFNYHRDTAGGELQPIRITINQHGYRGPPANAAVDPARRVLLLGDSNFFGYPLDDAHTLPQVLDRLLAERHPDAGYEVLNGGVPGYSVIQGWRWYRETFGDLRAGTLVLSYLNNDAWPQPHTDAEVLRFQESPLRPLADLARRSRLLAWVRGTLGKGAAPAGGYVPRVPIGEFLGYYGRFMTAARNMGARVVILDYRAYPMYEPYSRALRDLAAREGARYVNVAASLPDREQHRQVLEKYPREARRIGRRWGSGNLGDRPHLWYYAEMYPEHLNELGVLWVAEMVLPFLTPLGEDALPVAEQGRQGF